jgi:hypothetical protein
VAGGAVQDGGEHVQTIVTTTPSRRRRAASWRLPPLGSGRRDPLDGLRRPVADIPCHRAVIGVDGRWRRCCGRGAA